MKIQILQLIDGAKKATGLTVIIDVFRAMTVEAHVINNGASDLIPIGSIDDAYKYRNEHPGTILIGERGGKKCPGFDFGNSPSAVKDYDFTGKTVVHTTSAGTQGVANAKGADEIIGGSLVTAKAIAKYIKEKNPEVVSLVCMGLAGEKETTEDTLCAEYIKYILENGSEAGFDMEAGIKKCAETDGAKFFDKNRQEVFPEEDFHMSVDADRFDFVLKIEEGSDGFMHTRRA
ncbi:MAG: 2-phosphosulfolactate phosphatase [Eubacteriales bacterium]|nr:2-phosphosulfolactate phosphatase [Eubacteriales bacterium]